MRRRIVFYLAVAAAVLGLDQWTKYLAVEHLTTRFDRAVGVVAELGALYGEPPSPRPGGYHYTPRGKVEVLPGLLRLRYAENPGAAWGLFRSLPPKVRGPFFHVISLGAVVLISWYYLTLKGTKQERWAWLGLPLMLGGTLGNYVDRVARAFVIDFIEAHWFDKAHWPSFNVADMALVVGVGALVVDAFVRRERKAAA